MRYLVEVKKDDFADIGADEVVFNDAGGVEFYTNILLPVDIGGGIMHNVPHRAFEVAYPAGQWFSVCAAGYE